MLRYMVGMLAMAPFLPCQFCCANARVVLVPSETASASYAVSVRAGRMAPTIAVGMPITGHPPHRTGRAALSGSAAIAGFCPHRTHRAALPQWALQEGPEAD